eukprot:9447865-Heterocapsa_arctica.AAC.1
MVCVEGQGRDESHRRQPAAEGPPIVELDYSFLRTAEPDNVLSTVLLGYLKRKGYGFAMKVGCKGPTDRNAVSSVLLWLTELGLQKGPIRLRTDSEASIRAVAASVAASRDQGDTILEVSPVHSSSSLGAVERWSQTLAGLVRTLLLDLGRRLGMKIRSRDALFPWAVRHAAYVHNRYQPMAHGPIPFGQLQHRAYRSKMLSFGSPVLIRLPYCLGATQARSKVARIGRALGRLDGGNQCWQECEAVGQRQWRRA